MNFVLDLRAKSVTDMVVDSLGPAPAKLDDDSDMEDDEEEEDDAESDDDKMDTILEEEEEEEDIPEEKGVSYLVDV